MKKTSQRMLVPLTILALGIGIISTVDAVEAFGQKPGSGPILGHNNNPGPTYVQNSDNDFNHWNEGHDSNRWDKGHDFKSGYHGYWNYPYMPYYWYYRSMPYYQYWYYPYWNHHPYDHKKH